MKSIAAVILALVAMVGIVGAQEPSYSVNEAYQSGSNYANVYIGGGNGYYYPYDYYYGYGGSTNVVGSPITIIQTVNQDQAVAQSQGGVAGDSDEAPGADTSSQSQAPSIPTAPNGMAIVSQGTYIQDEFVLANVAPVPYVEYLGYGAVVVEQKGLSYDKMAEIAGVFFNSTEMDVSLVYFEQGVTFKVDGSVVDGKLDLSSPPRVARAFAQL